MRNFAGVDLKFHIEVAEAGIVRYDCARERLARLGVDTRTIDAIIAGLWRDHGRFLEELYRRQVEPQRPRCPNCLLPMPLSAEELAAAIERSRKLAGQL